MSDGSLSLRVTGLVSGYTQAPVIRGVDLEVGQGEVLAILGKNGMGKSTLLKTLMGFVKPRAGSIEFFGRQVLGEAPHRRAADAISYTPQEYTLFQDLSVGDNLRLGVPTDALLRDRMELVREYFPVLEKRWKQTAGTLSGGEQKMLLISRALLARPRLMLVDEISEGLQPTMIERVADVLRDARERLGTSIVLVEQNLSFALSLADRYAVLKLGEVAASDDAGSADARATAARHLRV